MRATTCRIRSASTAPARPHVLRAAPRAVRLVRPAIAGGDEPSRGGDREMASRTAGPGEERGRVPSVGAMGSTVDEDVAAAVTGYDEEEPGMDAPIRAGLTPDSVRGGLRPGRASPQPGSAAGEGSATADTAAAGREAGGEREGQGAGPGTAGASGGGGHGAEGTPGVAGKITVEQGGVQMVTGSDEVSSAAEVPEEMRELVRDALRQEMADE